MALKRTITSDVTGMSTKEPGPKDQCANSAKTKKECSYGHEIDERLESEEKF